MKWSVTTVYPALLANTVSGAHVPAHNGSVPPSVFNAGQPVFATPVTTAW
jgi:hypothetical protein